MALVFSLILAYLASFYIFEFYNLRLNFKGTDFLASFGEAFGLSYLFAIANFYIFPYKLGRGVFLISWILTGFFIYAWRFLYSTLFRLQKPYRNVLILGDGARAESIIPGLKNDPEFRLSAIMDKRVVGEMLGHEGRADRRVTLEQFIQLNKINDIVLSFDKNGSDELERTLVNCRMKGIGCHSFESFYERLLEKLPVLMLDDHWFLISEGFGTLGNRFYSILKRAVDFVAACLVLTIASPICALVAILIPLTSRGPVFFTQYRLRAIKSLSRSSSSEPWCATLKNWARSGPKKRTPGSPRWAPSSGACASTRSPSSSTFSAGR